MKNDNMRWILLGIAALIFFGMQETIPKEAVADVEGMECVEDADCPCWGPVEGSTDAYGLGLARCVDGQCNIDYCFDVGPVGEWLEKNPVQWVKDNMLMTAAFIGLLVLALFWPKM